MAANGTKVYNIKINGLQESVSAADALLAKLNALEERLNKISSMGVKLNSGGSSAQELTAQETLINKIAAAEKRVEEARDQNYQYLLKLKDELKEVTAEQKALTAASKLEENAYDLNTMAGIKERLKDIKALMQTTDIGSDLFQSLIDEADTLGRKLFDIEKQYGQFGRNVGNYTSAFGGLSGISVTIGDTTVQFKSAAEAVKTLGNQLKNLRAEGKENTKEFLEVADALDNLQDAVDGVSSDMSALLNTFQSFGAIASIAGGLSAFFGNSSDIEKSIQRLVALQNVLQGIQELNKQMQTSKGLGAALAKGNSAIDRFVASITKAKIGAEGLEMASAGATTAVRTLSTVLKGLGIGVIVAAITSLAYAFEKVQTEIAKGINQTDAFKASLDGLVKTLERRNDALKASYIKGEITDEQYLSQALDSQNKYLKENISLLEQRSKANSIWNTLGGRYTSRRLNIDNPLGNAKLTGWTGTQSIRNIEEARQKVVELNQQLMKGVGFWDDLFGVTSRNHVLASNVVLSDFIARIKKIDPAADGAQEAIADLYDEMNDDEALRSILLNLDKLIPSEEAVELINQITNALSSLNAQAEASSSVMASKIAHWKNDLNSDDLQRQLDELELQFKEELSQYGQNEEAKNVLIERYNKQRRDILKQIGRRRLQDENEIQRRLISSLKDGLAKQLKELELERKEAQEQAIASERMVNEKLLAIQKEFDRKELEAKKAHKEQMVGVYNEMWTQIYENQMQIQTMMSNSALAQQENLLEDKLNKDIIGGAPYVKGYKIDYANVGETAKELFRGGFDKNILEMASLLKLLEDEMFRYQQVYEELYLKEAMGVKLTEQEIKLGNANLELYKRLEQTIAEFKDSDQYKANADAITDALDFVEKHLTDTEAASLRTQFLGMTNAFDYYYEKRLEAVRNFYKEKEAIDKNQAENEYEFNRQEELRAYEMLMDEYKNQRKFELDSLVEDENYYNERSKILEKYNELIDTSTDQHHQKLEALEKNHIENIKKIENEGYESIRNETANRFQGIIREYENFGNKLASVLANYPITDNSGWGVINISATKRRNEELLEGYRSLAYKIIQEKERLQKALDADEISFDDFRLANEQLNELQQQVVKAADTVKKNAKNLIGDFINSINTYVQALGSGLQNILSWVADYEDSIYNKRIEQLDKYIDQYEDAMQKQQEITQKYAENVNSIEDELATARGDRRQQLIDMLNQQKAAQRASLNEEKRIEKEKEAMEAKKEQLELEQRRREHKRQITDAIVSAALAVVNGLATKPFVPLGIAMGALAGALGAVQVALIKAQKYKDGGVIEGKTHAQGGVKVLGGRAEVEGGEYITNKQTTQKNVQLLEYINSKKKRIDLADLVEFYGGGLRKQVKTVKTKFADGGCIPVLRNDISINDRFVRALEAYENKPTVVSVVEIMDKTKSVKNVQAIAGLTDD